VPAQRYCRSPWTRSEFSRIGQTISSILAGGRSRQRYCSELFQISPAVIRFYAALSNAEQKLWVVCVDKWRWSSSDYLACWARSGRISVVPNAVPEIKKIIRSIHYTEAIRVAERVLMMRPKTRSKPTSRIWWSVSFLIFPSNKHENSLWFENKERAGKWRKLIVFSEPFKFILSETLKGTWWRSDITRRDPKGMSIWIADFPNDWTSRSLGKESK